MIYTALCIDTGGYETRPDPHLNSVRQFRIDENTAGEAETQATQNLLDEFGREYFYNWRVFITEGTPNFVTGSYLIPIIDKVTETNDEGVTV